MEGVVWRSSEGLWSAATEAATETPAKKQQQLQQQNNANHGSSSRSTRVSLDSQDRASVRAKATTGVVVFLS